MVEEYQIKKLIPNDIQVPDNVVSNVKDFSEQFSPMEDILYLMIDARTNAFYCECHIMADVILEYSTIDVPLDPDDQGEYRANRELVEDHVAFIQMKEDAEKRRTFSNIVAEYDLSNNPDYPLKIIGGQHRFEAIKGAYKNKVNEYHGVKIYFDLDTDQRLDVQLISNVNISVSSDLYDRLWETARGPELRDWCQKVGFLENNQDFSAKRKRGEAITVRSARSFIMNFYLGKNINPREFSEIDTTPIIAKTGETDEDWEDLIKTKKDIWEDEELAQAAKKFTKLDEAQYESASASGSSSHANKAQNFSIMTAWAYIAGVLQNNKTRLKRHYELPERRSGNIDPLNAKALEQGRHKSDPENYRGVGTRSNSSERGRCAELFFYVAEKGENITKKTVDIAIHSHVKKQADLDLMRIKGGE